MKSGFDEFIDSIPCDIHSNTKSYISKNVAIFIPEEFVINRKIKILDYHFVIFHTTPPPAIIGDSEFQFKKGSFVSIEPGKEIEVNPLFSVGQVKFITICIKKDFFEKIAWQIVDMEKIKFENKHNAYSHQLLDLIELWLKEMIGFGENCTLMLESIETQMVIQLLRDSLPKRLRNRRIKFSDNDYINQSIKYMEKYYSSNISISDICNNIYISPCHFQRIFKNHMNQTPYNYLLKLRISKAKEKLEENAINIQEVARLCGFVSSTHFSSVFKRIEGLSPTDYRKENAKTPL